MGDYSNMGGYGSGGNGYQNTLNQGVAASFPKMEFGLPQIAPGGGASFNPSAFGTDSLNQSIDSAFGGNSFNSLFSGGGNDGILGYLGQGWDGIGGMDGFQSLLGSGIGLGTMGLGIAQHKQSKKLGNAYMKNTEEELALKRQAYQEEKAIDTAIRNRVANENKLTTGRG